MIGYYQHPFIPIPQKSTTHCPKASLVHGVLVCHWLIDNPVGISILKISQNASWLDAPPNNLHTASLNENGSCPTTGRELLAPWTSGIIIWDSQKFACPDHQTMKAQTLFVVGKQNPKPLPALRCRFVKPNTAISKSLLCLNGQCLNKTCHNSCIIYVLERSRIPHHSSPSVACKFWNALKKRILLPEKHYI